MHHLSNSGSRSTVMSLESSPETCATDVSVAPKCPQYEGTVGKRRWRCRSTRRPSVLSSFFLLLLLWALVDDSPRIRVVESQSTPTVIVVTPTPVSSPNAPTRRPTFRPVASTDPPTTNPPTPNPTEEQSNTPTLQPTLPPSPSPTQSPIQPTAIPTVSPKPSSVTLAPTKSAPPSSAPSKAPTTPAPVLKPTRKPVTAQPSPSPSQAPSPAPQIQVVSVSTLLERTNGKLEGKASFDFESVTETFILAQLRELEQKEQVRFTQLEVNVYGQSVATSTRRRRLQSNFIRLQVTYNTLVVFQSLDGSEEDRPVEEWIGTAFNNRTKRNSYISKLQAANGDAFSAVERVTVAVDGEPPTTVDEDKSTVWSNETMWIIIGAVGGTLALIIIVSTLYIMGRRRRKHDDELESAGPHGRAGKHSISNETRPIPQAFSYDSDSQNQKFTAEIDVDFQTDDVSTLGDPTYYGGAMDQRTVAPNGAPYAVPSRSRLLSDEDDDLLLASAESNLSKQNDNDIVVRTVVEQDTWSHSGGRKFAVEVPPGKLGMIIDSPMANAPPVVHTIKPESILVATVQAGDLLLAVDGRDVTQYTAVQVSQLISAQSDQQRTLVFLRQPQQRERFHSTSSETEEMNGAC